MTKSMYIKEIAENITIFDSKKLKEISNFIKFLKYQDFMDPTLEILSNEERVNLKNSQRSL
ncbi:MAG: hypothetical protein WCT77_00965 [Bacteroidota bacterium]